MATDALLARVMLGTGGARLRAASGAASELLQAFGGIAGLSRAHPDDLAARLAGALGPRARSRAEALACAFELGRRASGPGDLPKRIADASAVGAWGKARLGALEHEELWVLALDGTNRLRAASCVAKGGLHGVGVRAADVLRAAIRSAASGFVLVHNHPSGDPTPSSHDVAFTRTIADAGAVVGVPLLDHVVVTSESSASVPFDASCA